ncbi:ATP-dependent RecD-like DNA helicase [Candidatus Lokiarchaeum ossiferum]|uniref:ATP-dependent RecD-like DNA helicase n=1 Tax=Candidatus Lokiarchaeum ossiferum TaxID=2951803 RepID=A0ABY6HZD4_9ARCH|nr:ATP-dependent RecD-like DNA helicase [Candidatus Lokiarchaeum sp. B-35]
MFENNVLISLKSPLICKLIKIIKFNVENEFLTVIIEDDEKSQILAFIYGDLAQFLNTPVIQASLLPLSITIFKGQFKELKKGNLYLEIHQAILDNQTYINSNWIGTHEYCSLQTYLKIHVNISSAPNENLLWGNLFHDYLSNIFSQKNLAKLVKHPTPLKSAVKSAFIKAIFQNWRLFVALRKDYGAAIDEFESNFFDDEVQFIIEELNKYKQEYGNFEFVCEKMVFSKHFGLQGRIDRIVQNIPFTHFKIIETKTGKSPRSSQVIAYYQSMAYATMLQEYFPSKLDTILIEYPRLGLEDRFIKYDYDERELLKVLKIRNEIWNIYMGAFPPRNNLLPCSKCGSKEICTFYEFKFAKETNQEINTDNRFRTIFEKNTKTRTLFKRVNAYHSWFFWLLNQEFFLNLKLINEIHSNPEIREAKGNCIANLSMNLNQIAENPSRFIKNLSFIKDTGELIENTRLRVGDYVIITPQNYIPLTSESERGLVSAITKTQVFIELAKSLEKGSHFFSSSKYRIDLTTSNFMVDLQKTFLDTLIRNAFYPKVTSTSTLLHLLLFTKDPQLNQYNKITPLNTEMFQKFDFSQKKAVEVALNSLNLTLIQGPPGTGKTTVIVEIIHQLLSGSRLRKNTIKKNHKKGTLGHYMEKTIEKVHSIRPILLSSFTNKALDNIILKLLKTHPKLKIVRLGNISSIKDPLILSHSIENICARQYKLPNGENEDIIDPLKVQLILEKADIVACTTTVAGNVILTNIGFETVILDEAGQITESSALIPLLKANKYILVGDHQQLPPIAKEIQQEIPKEIEEYSDVLHLDLEKGLGCSIFERLSVEFSNSPNFVLLSYQYRMNSQISEFISQTFYHGNLNTGSIASNNVGSQTLNDFFESFCISNFNLKGKFSKYLEPEIPMIFLDTKELNSLDSGQFDISKKLESKFNSCEAEIIGEIIGSFLFELVQEGIKIPTITEIFKKIGIISGYRAQNQLIRDEIHKFIGRKYSGLLENLSLKSTDLLSIGNKIVVDTVDRFQGQEREIIFYSFVDSNPKLQIHSLNQEKRRLNVAISRSKKKIIFVGNSLTLSKSVPSDCSKSKNVKEIHSNLISYIKDSQGYFILNK